MSVDFENNYLVLIIISLKGVMVLLLVYGYY